MILKVDIKVKKRFGIVTILGNLSVLFLPFICKDIKVEKLLIFVSSNPDHLRKMYMYCMIKLYARCLQACGLLMCYRRSFIDGKIGTSVTL